jgi:hypothetical protein
MFVTEHTYVKEIRESLKLDITVAMLVTCGRKATLVLSIIKFEKRGMFWHWSPQNIRRERNL